MKQDSALATQFRSQRACLPCLLLSCVLALTTLPAAASHAGLPDDLTEMSLEALMDIDVMSAAKRNQKKSEAAAAIFVISNADLRRWGVNTIPDALRRVPGLHVARIDANKWAITARGFNSRFANKLLVLIDGRSVYTPLFAGVYWEANDVMLEDVERIEVIRGPGGTLWGANAVNGVINIITRNAADTQGSLVSAGAGNEEKGFTSLRYGAGGPDGMHYRVYGKFRKVDSGEAFESRFPTEAHDDSEFGQAGFRSDWSTGSDSHHTLQGDAYRGHADQQLLTASEPGPVTENSQYRGANLLYRWTQQAGDGSGHHLQFYIDHVKLDSSTLFEDRQTLDIEFQKNHHIAGRHELVWGLSYRGIQDDTETHPDFSLFPSHRTASLYTAFIQDEISLFDEKAVLTLGTKLEHNDFTGIESQPNIRLAWFPENSSTVWAAVSRAVRTPARGEHDVVLTLPALPPSPEILIYGSDSFGSEHLTAYELGYRFNPRANVSIDIATFYNEYDHLRSVEITSPPPPPFDATFGNNLTGNTQGLEIEANWRISPHLDIHANYTRLEIDLELVNDSIDSMSRGAEHASPVHQANLWLSRRLASGVELDAGVRHVDSVQVPGMAEIPSYTALDLRLGWKPWHNVELSLAGQNLLDSAHPEFSPDFIYTLPTEAERSFYGKLTWTFR